MTNLIDNKSSPHGYMYHYTVQSGLFGIIKSKQLWATNILYLNDSAELSYSIELVEEQINKLLSSLSTSVEKEFLSNFLQGLKVARYMYIQRGADIFVCSFSAKRDDLSQWRGYSYSGNGYSIGFDFNSTLRAIIEEQGFDLAKCVYDIKEQSVIVRDFLINMLDKFRTEKAGTQNSRQFEQTLLSQFHTEFLRLAPKFKHPSFHEEDEWRLVSLPLSAGPRIKFREGKSMFIPYIEINLVENATADSLIWIPEIWIGPTPNSFLSAKSLETLLISHRVESHWFGDNRPSEPRLIIPGVRISEIPYRVLTAL